MAQTPEPVAPEFERGPAVAGQPPEGQAAQLNDQAALIPPPEEPPPPAPPEVGSAAEAGPEEAPAEGASPPSPGGDLGGPPTGEPPFKPVTEFEQAMHAPPTSDALYTPLRPVDPVQYANWLPWLAAAAANPDAPPVIKQILQAVTLGQ